MSNKSINNSKISNIELVNNDAEITHTTGNGTFTIDSEDGNILSDDDTKDDTNSDSSMNSSNTNEEYVDLYLPQNSLYLL